MLVRNAVWQRIRSQFTEDEKDELNGAIDGQVLCPPSISLDERGVKPALLLKLRDAVTAVAPGA